METKYPIILVHGIAVKDVAFVKSFGRIDKILQGEGFTVYKSKTDSFGCIEDNGETLKKEITKIVEETGCEKVNIIAHSKGGLDSIYMIEKLGMEKYVASLTTLCTPHKGSPIASWILRLPRWLLRIVAFFVNFFYRILGDKHPDALRVCEQLKRSGSIEKKTLNVKADIYVQSYSASMKKTRDDFIMGVPLLVSHYSERVVDSDGLVPEDSTKFGEYKGEAIQDSISHAEIIDFTVNKKKKEKVYAFYSSVCKSLKDRGL